MADVDIDPFGEHELRPEEPTDEHIPLSLVGEGSTWEPTRKKRKHHSEEQSLKELNS